MQDCGPKVHARPVTRGCFSGGEDQKEKKLARKRQQRKSTMPAKEDRYLKNEDP